MDTFFVDAERSDADENGPMRMRYVAMAPTPDQAVQAVRTLVAPDLKLQCEGKTLSPMIAKALGVRPGQARLV